MLFHLLHHRNDRLGAGVDLSLPEGLEHRRARGGSFLQMILYLLIAQMLAVAIFAGMLQF